MLIASGSPGVVAGASLLSLSVSAPLGLVATARLGMMGAALSWLLYSLVLSVHVVAHSARRLLYTTPAGWWLTTGRTLGAGLLCFVPPLVLASRLGASDALLAGLYGLACALFLVVCARGLMGDELRSSVLVLSRQLRLRLARST
jgi:O-antigen/teichoic acid export membrane protein